MMVFRILPLAVLTSLPLLVAAYSPQNNHGGTKISHPTPPVAPALDAAADAPISARDARIRAPLSASAALLGLSSSLAVMPPPRPAYAGVGATAPFDETRKRNFPGSLLNSVVTLRVESAFRKKKYTFKNTVLAYAKCPDDVTPTPASVAGMVFGSSSLGVTPVKCDPGGSPSDMKTSLSDLASKCPDGGHIVVFFGPHVGIDKEGRVGYLERVRDEEAEPTCPVVLQKVAAAKGGKVDEGAIVDATKQLYMTIRNQMDSQVASALQGGAFWDSGANGSKSVSELTLVGGININRAKFGKDKDKGEDCFYPLYAKTLTAKGTTIDLYDPMFGDMNVPPKDME